MLKRFGKPRRCRLCLFAIILIITGASVNSCLGDVGTAAQYNPPYLPTMCYGNDPSEFPLSNLFAAAGDGIWDNGASCGRQYLVRCISATQPGTCVPDQTILIKIVDYAPGAPSNPTAAGTSIVLSETAFGIIANPTAVAINVEFQQALSASSKQARRLKPNVQRQDEACSVVALMIMKWVSDAIQGIERVRSLIRRVLQGLQI